ncbi:SRPBCC family protein [uncultured Ramlibacter sp.]|uniref:SRPBCC family protein n=1 Tax=uncultured Ramlibacter sp. TaxID=260755 RepID=UPI0026079BEE|nr:SRPBCC family protein [uncultured Ramlibacter sp.]
MRTTAQDPREIHSQRLLSGVTPAQVFQAFADPQRLARWWGPAGFRNSFDVFEFRPGGDWVFTMHGPDGKGYPNRSRFETIEPDATIVFQHLNAPVFRMTITLAAEDGGTRIGWRMLFDNAQLREQIAAIVVPANEQNFDRLQAQLRPHS